MRAPSREDGYPAARIVLYGDPESERDTESVSLHDLDHANMRFYKPGWAVHIDERMECVWHVLAQWGMSPAVKLIRVFDESGRIVVGWREDLGMYRCEDPILRRAYRLEPRDG